MTDGPYKLPSGWRWVRLGEVASHLRSGFASRKKGAVHGDLLHLRPYNIAVDGTLNLSQQFLVPISSAPSGEIFLQPGDVLFNNTNSVELVGKTALVSTELRAAFSNHMTHIRMNIEVCEGAWIALALRSLWQQGYFAQRCNKWIGQAGFNTNMLIAIPIPLPPLAEQRRIVARVEALMERVREAKRLQSEGREDAGRLIQAVLSEIFLLPHSPLPAGWLWKRLGEVAEKPQYGYTHPAVSEPVGPKFLRITDIQDGSVDWEKVPYCHCTPPPFMKYKLEPHDILFARSGATTGKTFVIRELSHKAVFASYLIRIRMKLETILAEFGYWFFQSPQYWEQIKPQGAAQPNMNAQALQQLNVPCPPLSDQRRIVAYLDSVQSQATALKRAQEDTDAELRRLEQAILDRAFRGEL